MPLANSFLRQHAERYRKQIAGFDESARERLLQHRFPGNIRELDHIVERAVLMTYSEFGRRPEENGDQGTDHGTAEPILVVGDHVKGGLHGAQPSLTALDDDGNLVPTVDFRAVYASVLRTWLKADAPPQASASPNRVVTRSSGGGTPREPTKTPHAPVSKSSDMIRGFVSVT